MKELRFIACDPEHPEICSQKLSNEITQGSWIRLAPKNSDQRIIMPTSLPKGPGFILKGGGSSGTHHECLHPSSHLDQSASATANWLYSQGLDPNSCQILNPLPLHHVSGLLAWWRSRCWESKHIWLSPKLMRDPEKLEKRCNSFINNKKGPVITSLVPIQLNRLLQHPSGIRWLQLCRVIWIGGSAISKNLAKKSRALNIHLAPCYGSTETAAMVSVQTPEEFLSGNNTTGTPLKDVEFRLGNKKALEIRTKRLAKILKDDGSIQSLEDKEGWWKSGDMANLVLNNKVQELRIIGRRDTAITTGGETVFPEQLQSQLHHAAQQKGLPLEKLLLTPIVNEEWGERLITLVKFKANQSRVQKQKAFLQLQRLVEKWPTFKKPIAWYECPELSLNELGKWEMKKWKEWVTAKEN